MSLSISKKGEPSSAIDVSSDDTATDLEQALVSAGIFLADQIHATNKVGNNFTLELKEESLPLDMSIDDYLDVEGALKREDNTTVEASVLIVQERNIVNGKILLDASGGAQPELAMYLPSNASAVEAKDVIESLLESVHATADGSPHAVDVSLQQGGSGSRIWNFIYFSTWQPSFAA